MEHTITEAAALLDIGRNTLARELRRLKMLDKHNMPAGPFRGKGIFVVKTGTYEHPTRGKTPYTKTLITDRGLELIRHRLPPKEETPMNNQPEQQPTGRVHDLGELTVINEDHGRCHHRVAMVVVFDSPEQAQACVKAGTVRLIPSMDLNPDATEALRHGG